MRNVRGAALILLLSGCGITAQQPAPAEPLASDPITPCQEPRPELCTMEYAPACARFVEGGFRTYASPCNACADTAVAGYQPGACTE